MLAGASACGGADDEGRPDGGPTRADAGPTDAAPTDGGSDAGAGDLGRADGGGGLPGCLEVEDDTSADFDLVGSQPVAFAFELNGETPPPASSGRERGLVTFRHQVRGGVAGVPLPGSGPAEGVAEVVPGPHEVVFQSGSCEPPDATPYCQRLRGEIAVQPPSATWRAAFGAMELEITVDGAPPPELADVPRGFVSLRPVGEGPSFTRSFRLPDSGPAQVATGAFHGTYEGTFIPTCIGDAICGEADFGPIEVAGDVRRTIDLQSVEVTGTVTQNGAPIQSTGVVAPGSVSFHRPGGRLAVASVQLEQDGTYAVRLLAGRYDVYFDGIEGLGPTDAPITSVALTSGLEIEADRELDFDLSTREVRLSVTANGEPLSAAIDGGHLRIVDASGRGTTFVDLATLRSAWTRQAITGTYRVEFAPPFECTSDLGIPCAGAVVASSVELEGDIAFDLASREVTFGLAVNGSGLPDSTASRGRISVVPLDLDSSRFASADLPATGALESSARLAPGRYAVSYSAPFGDDRCAAGELGPVPCGTTPLGEVEISETDRVALSLETARLTGRVSVDGRPLALPVDSGAQIAFAQGRNAFYPTVLAADGSYEIWLPPADYSVSYSPVRACEGDSVPAPRPCAGQTVRACPRAP
jgi:hypothetical protein